MSVALIYRTEDSFVTFTHQPYLTDSTFPNVCYVCYVYSCYFLSSVSHFFKNLLSGLYGPYPKLEPTLTKLTEEFLDWQWTDYLSKEVRELEGVVY